MTPMAEVWLVDDDVADNHFHERVLRRSDFTDRVKSFERPEVALAALCDPAVELPSLLLLDINMPGMSGFELLERLSASCPRRLTELDVYVLSTSADRSEERRALAMSGVRGFFVKPLNGEHLAVIESSSPAADEE